MLSLRTTALVALSGMAGMAGLAGATGILATGCDSGEHSQTSGTSGTSGTGGAGSGGAAATTTTTTTGSPSGTTGSGGATTTTSSTTSSSSSTTSTTTSGGVGGSTSGLHVEGKNFVDNGKTVRLLGVDRSGTEYSCIQGNGFFDGPVDQTAVSAIVAWHANTVRVPLNEDCWLGINGAKAQYSGTAYQNAIAGFVSLLRQNGLYVILDLHWNGGGSNVANGQQEMADADHAPAFWTGVAGAFKSDQGVIFDLYNEPHDIPWSCWLSGGCQTNGWTVAGMQQLLDAVRATGAENVVMAGGIAYASDLSGWLANKPNDPKNNLAASFHTYNFTGCNSASCWNGVLQPLAAQVPLVTGELGENDCAHGYVDGYMSWADTAGVSYLGWAWNADFNCNSGPSLISNWNGTASGMGAGFQTHLAAVNP